MLPNNPWVEEVREKSENIVNRMIMKAQQVKICEMQKEITEINETEKKPNVGSVGRLRKLIKLSQKYSRKTERKQKLATSE